MVHTPLVTVPGPALQVISIYEHQQPHTSAMHFK
jgi:hypothetical protein